MTRFVRMLVLALLCSVFVFGTSQAQDTLATDSVDAVKKDLIQKLTAQGIALSPVVVAFLPNGPFVPEGEKASLSIVAGQNRPDVRRLLIVVKRQGALFPMVFDKQIEGLSQFQAVKIWSAGSSVLSSGNYDVNIFINRDDNSYIESIRTRFSYGFVQNGADEDGMTVAEFKTYFVGNGWYASIKGHDLGLKALVVVTFFGLTIPFEINPVVDGNHDAEAFFELPFGISQPFGDTTQYCDLVVQRLDGVRSESVTRHRYVRLRTKVE